MVKTIRLPRTGSHFPSHFALRLFYYVGGLLILAFGVILATLSGLGIAPINSMPYVLSKISGWKLGTCVFSVYALFVAAQIALERKCFLMVDIGQLLVSALFSTFVDLARSILGSSAVSGYPLRLLLLLGSILISALGVAMYVGAGLINMPADGFVQTIIQKRQGWQFGSVKQVLDCSAVVVSVTMSLLFLGHMDGIREGTILTALLLGRLVRLFQTHLPGLRTIAGRS